MSMTENEAVERLKCMRLFMQIEDKRNKSKFLEDDYIANKMAIQALEEIQQYRAYKEIFESHFSKEALELLSDKAEFGKWLERGKWIAKKCDEINIKLESFEAIGTIEEFKALKEKSVAKKPTDISKVRDNEGYIGLVGKCPSCGEILEEDTVNCDCGQKIDWQ